MNSFFLYFLQKIEMLFLALSSLFVMGEMYFLEFRAALVALKLCGRYPARGWSLEFECLSCW